MKLDAYTIVTGGSGFIGSCVIRELNSRSYSNIIVVDNLGESEKWKNLVGKRFADSLHKADLFSWLDVHGPSVGAIIHLGACSETTQKDANYLLENNYRYTRKLAEFAIRNDIRFVYASSAATYGDGAQGFSDEHSLLENLRPLNMYGYSKHLFDLWLAQNNLLDKVAGLKYFNVYGPNEWHKGKMTSAIVRMVPQVLKEKKISLFQSYLPDYANGEQLRDFIYVKDVAAITCDILESDCCGIFNVGTGEASSWNRLGKAVFAALNVKPNIEYMPMPDELVGKYQYFTEASVGKLEGALQRKVVRYSLEEAVCDYVISHLKEKVFW